KKHSFRISQMGDRQYGYSRLALFRIQEMLDLERFTLHPSLKARRGQQIVQPNRQGHALLFWIKRFGRQHADFVKWGLLNLADEPWKIEIDLFAPTFLQNGCNQDVFAALDRIRLNSNKAEQTGCSR